MGLKRRGGVIGRTKRDFRFLNSVRRNRRKFPALFLAIHRLGEYLGRKR